MRQVLHPTSHAGSPSTSERERVAVVMFAICSACSNMSRKFPAVILMASAVGACSGPAAPEGANQQALPSISAAAPEKIDRSAPTPQPMRRLIVAFEMTGPPARPVVRGTTNLPDGTQIGAAFTRIGGQYATMGNGEVREGRFAITLGDPLGGGLPPGRYDVEVNTPVANVQPDDVRAIVGPDYENFTGPLFSDGEYGRMVSVKKVHLVPGEFDDAARSDLQARRSAMARQFAKDNCVRAREADGLATRTPRAQQEIDDCVARNERAP